MILVSLINMKRVSLVGRHGPLSNFSQVFLCVILFLVVYLVLIEHLSALTGLLVFFGPRRL